MVQVWLPEATAVSDLSDVVGECLACGIRLYGIDHKFVCEACGSMYCSASHGSLSDEIFGCRLCRDRQVDSLTLLSELLEIIGMSRENAINLVIGHLLNKQDAKKK